MSLVTGIQTLATRIANEIRDVVMPRVLPSGGAMNDVLRKTSALDYSVGWVAPFSGSYNDLTDQPSLFSGSYNSLTDVPLVLQGTTASFTTTLETKLNGIEALADVTDAGNVGAAIAGVVAKATPADADQLGLIDSAASNVLKKFTWANLKTALSSVFAAASHGHGVADITFNDNILPDTNNAYALGSATASWADLFLADGGEISFNAGAMKITHDAVGFTFSGSQEAHWFAFDSDLVPTALGKNLGDTGSGPNRWASLNLGDDSTVEFGDGGDFNIRHDHTSNYLAFESFSGTYRFDGAVRPVANDGAALGAAAASWSDLFLASGAVVNFANGDVTITHSTQTATFGGTSSVDWFFKGDVLPSEDGGYSLGSSSFQWFNLYLADTGAIRFGNGNVTITHGSNSLTLAGGKFNTAASTTTRAGLSLPHGAAPTTPVNGDVWTTTTGLYARINGVTVGPFGTGGGGGEPVIAAGTTADYWRGDKTWQVLNKAAVGLANVDNTSDTNKPISTATQTALNGKANSSHTHTASEVTDLGTAATKNIHVGTTAPASPAVGDLWVDTN